jgi:signal peptidase II
VPVGRVALGAAVAAVVVAADQVTKTLALHHLVLPRHVVGTLWLELTFNSGASFGVGRGATPVIEVVVVLILAVGLLLFGRRATRTASKVAMVGIGLMVGGAISNLADRVLRHNHGAVIDFIDIAQVGRRELWPVFNVADSAIVVGAIVVVSSYSFTGRRVAPSKECAPAARIDETENTDG